jgi:hypothetical protein
VIGGDISPKGVCTKVRQKGGVIQEGSEGEEGKRREIQIHM